MGSSPRKGEIIAVGLCGAAGRMGRELFRAAALSADIIIAKAYEASGHRSLNTQIGEAVIQPDDAPDFLDGCQALVDFSAPPEALLPHLRHAAEKKVAAVIGSTGFSPEIRAQMERLAPQIPLLYSANMSLGINLLTLLARRVQELLPGAFDVDIIEMHHRSKRDTPSGTAMMIAQQLQQVTPGQKISQHSLRAGDVIGEHTVLFTGVGERLELTHRAASREAFALGTLAAVRFIVTAKPGFYDMHHVLGI
jgi:4-hydroxy-tetrahydrodipicolinate reductase